MRLICSTLLNLYMFKSYNLDRRQETKTTDDFYSVFPPLNTCAGNMVKRRNIKSMTILELNEYFETIKKLNSLTKPSFWDKFAKFHVEKYDSVHSQPQFLPWHRALLFMLEAELRKINNNASIPYWDWTEYSIKPINDIALQDFSFGGDGDEKNLSCISTGLYKNITVTYDGHGVAKDHCLRRKFNEKMNSGIIWTSPESVQIYVMNTGNFKEFWQKLEGGPHASIHNGLGLDFKEFASPSDPLFWSHHAFVDKLWYDWQNKNPNLKYSYEGNSDEILNSMDYSVKDMFDIDPLCYKY